MIVVGLYSWCYYYHARFIFIILDANTVVMQYAVGDTETDEDDYRGHLLQSVRNYIYYNTWGELVGNMVGRLDMKLWRFGASLFGRDMPLCQF
jgi:hypothetical protein